MKNKHRRAFIQAYKWYDYTFMLEAIKDWASNSAKMHEKHGVHVGAHKVARQLRIVSHLCDRIAKDDYSVPHWFSHVDVHMHFGEEKRYANGSISYPAIFSYIPDEKTYRYVRDKRRKQRQKDLDMLTQLMSKNLFNWWD